MNVEPGAETYPIAELERRFYAFFIDRLLGWLLVAAVGLVVWVVLDDVRTAVIAAAGVLVLTWLALAIVVGVSGNTPGKAMVGLRVVHHGTGTSIGVGRSLVRSLILAVASVPTFALGLATLAWTAVEDRSRQRRGWHDQIAHSVVVDVRPVDEHVEEVDEGPRHVVNLTAMRLIPAPPVEPPAPPRRVNPEQSMRRTPIPGVTDANVDQPAPPVHPGPAPLPHSAEHGASTQFAPPPQMAPPPVAQPPVAQPPQMAPPPVAQPPVAQPPVAPPPVAPSPQMAPPLQAAPQGAPAQHFMPPPAAPAMDDSDRTVARPASTAEPTGPRWRVTFDNGQTFVVEGMALVGRRPEPRPGEHVHHLVPLTSADMSVSKTHAQFSPAADGVLVVMDRGSTNGTVLTRRGVSRPLAAGKPATLVDGDMVSFGDRQMVVRREE